MRVLYVARSGGPHDRRFIDAWLESGYEVEALFADDIVGDGAPGMDLAMRLNETFASNPPDLVQVGPITSPGAIVAEAWDGPLIATSWGFDLMHDIDELPSALAQARSVLRRADLVIVDNDGPARRARELGVPAARIVSFPWGVDLATFAAQDLTPGRRDNRRIVSVRRHEPLYRVGDVLDAFARAAQSDARLRLVMAGSGSLTDSLVQRAEGAGIADRVEWRGELDAADLAELLRSSGIYVSSSPVDGSSVSLLEAMAAGAAVAVTDIEGNRQWVDDSTGWTFPPGDTRHLADLMLRLSAGTEDLEARRHNARARIVEKADWSASAARFPEFASAAIEASRLRGWLG